MQKEDYLDIISDLLEIVENLSSEVKDLRKETYTDFQEVQDKLSNVGNSPWLYLQESNTFDDNSIYNLKEKIEKFKKDS